MKTYLEILEYTLTHGKNKDNRTGTKTIAVPNVHFSHNMEDGYPLLTTKKMAFKTMAVELEGFIKGITSKKWYQDRGCRIWDKWANPKVVKKIFYKLGLIFQDIEIGSYTKTEEEIQGSVDDLGAIYGYQWRRFGQAYDENDNGCVEQYDQFDNIIRTLKTNPNDRRMVCSAWNPVQTDRMALPPCHFAWVVTHIDGYLHLHWTQRSCDLFLGVPFNIASYALLLLLLCKESNLKPGNLSGMLCDCHIYENHIKQVEQQLLRHTKSLPSIDILNWRGIYNWTHQDVKLINYYPHPQIKAEVAI